MNNLVEIYNTVRPTDALHAIVNILLITGTHGNEVTPLYIGKKFIEFKKDIEERLKDLNFLPIKISLLQGSNYLALKNNTREFQVTEETKDPNRMFLNQEHLTLRDFKKELSLKIESHDLVIDIHSSHKINNCFLFDEASVKSELLINICQEAKVNYITRAFDGNTIKKYCNQRLGKFGVTYESEGLNEINYSSSLAGYSDIISFISVFLSKYSKFQDTEENISYGKITRHFRIPITAPQEGIVTERNHSFNVIPGQILGSIESIKDGKKYDLVVPKFINKDYKIKLIDLPSRSFVNVGDEVYSLLVEEIL